MNQNNKWNKANDSNAYVNKREFETLPYVSFDSILCILVRKCPKYYFIECSCYLEVLLMHNLFLLSVHTFVFSVSLHHQHSIFNIVLWVCLLLFM